MVFGIGPKELRRERSKGDRQSEPLPCWTRNYPQSQRGSSSYCHLSTLARRSHTLIFIFRHQPALTSPINTSAIAKLLFHSSLCTAISDLLSFSLFFWSIRNGGSGQLLSLRRRRCRNVVFHRLRPRFRGVSDSGTVAVAGERIRRRKLRRSLRLSCLGLLSPRLRQQLDYIIHHYVFDYI